MVHGRAAVTSCVEIGEPVDLALMLVGARSLAAGARGRRGGGHPARGRARGRLRRDRRATASARSRSSSSCAASSASTCVGPNCLGFVNVVDRAPAWSGMMPVRLVSGAVAIVSQSGATASEIATYAATQNIGLSHIISTGNEAMVDTIAMAVGRARGRARAGARDVRRVDSRRAAAQGARRARRRAREADRDDEGRDERARRRDRAHAHGRARRRRPPRRRRAAAVGHRPRRTRWKSWRSRPGCSRGRARCRREVSASSRSRAARATSSPTAPSSSGCRCRRSPRRTQARLAGAAPRVRHAAQSARHHRCGVREPAALRRRAARRWRTIRRSRRSRRFTSCRRKERAERFKPRLELIAPGLRRGRATRLPRRSDLARHRCVHGRCARGGRASRTRSPASATSVDAFANAVRWSAWLRRPHAPSRRRTSSTSTAAAVTWSEARGLELLAEHGVPVVPWRLARTAEEAVAAARDLGYPVVVEGRFAGDPAQERHRRRRARTWRRTATCARRSSASRPPARASKARTSRVRSSPRCAAAAIELIVGVVHDEQWGPALAVGLGGVWVHVARRHEPAPAAGR